MSAATPTKSTSELQKKNIGCIAYSTTKTVVLRQRLALSKRRNESSSIPEEMLCHIFKYLDASDLLKCMLVSQNWNRCASESNLWKNVFNNLPKATQKLSLDAKRPKVVDWKEQVMLCCIKRRKMKINDMIGKYEKQKRMLSKHRSSTCDIIKAVNSKWHLRITDDNGHNCFIKRSRVMYFADALTIYWDVSLSQTINNSIEISIIAATPIFYDASFKAVKGSSQTTSMVQTFKIKEQLANASLIGSDNHVTLHGVDNMIIGVWKRKKNRVDQDVCAFIVANYHGHNIIQRVFEGTSTQAYLPNDHVPVIDDFVANYGLTGYNVNLELRNTRGSLWKYTSHELVKGDVIGNHLVFIVTQSNGIDVFHHNFDFPWQTGSLFGKIKGAAILDLTITDINQQTIIAASAPVKITQQKQNTVNYNAGDDALDECRVLWSKKNVCSVEMQLLKEDEVKVVVTELVFRLDIPFINQWFGVQY